EKFYSKVKQIFVPPRPELAVVRGAVYAGLNPKAVTARISRRWYGVCQWMNFREGVDPESSRVKIDNIWRCQKRFGLMVKKGQKIGVDEYLEKELVIFKEFNSAGVIIPIYAFNGNETPPDYSTSSGMFKLAELNFDTPFSSTDVNSKIVTFKMYFGLSEIKATAKLDSREITTTLRFDATDVY
ncbi:Heat shock 70 kDa protein 12A, partial [Lunasporangiospora selenospora]